MWYQVWHKNTKVLDVKREGIEVLCKEKLPFDLRHYEEIGYHEFLAWFTRRISTLQRTYMNQLYKQRRIGRGHTEIINDSAAISPIDLFWITREDLSHTWESLQVLRDESMITARASLEGIIDPKTMFGVKEDHTSIFSVKGAFPKAIYRGTLLKKGSNAEYEIVGANIASHLGVSVAQAALTEEGAVACALFTSERVGLVHAIEYLYPFEIETYARIYEDALTKFSHRPDIIRQLERLFILSYLIQNNDLHGENFGWLYDNESFEILAVSPAYDFNAAFDAWEGIDMYDPFIFSKLQEFVNNNLDLLPKLKTLNIILESDEILAREQKLKINERASYICSLVKVADGEVKPPTGEYAKGLSIPFLGLSFL